MVNKIYITGPVGSGKSTLAWRLSKEFGFVCCELDSIVYEPYPNSSAGNRKRTEEDRNLLFNAVFSNEKWIIEDAGRKCFEIAWQKADSIILLEPCVNVRKRRIIFRWIKQKLHIEKCGYKPTLDMLKAMFRWTKNYEVGTDTLKEKLAPYKQKISLIRTERDIQQYINEHLTI